MTTPTPMMDNLLAAFKKLEVSPLYGKPLVYLVGSEADAFTAIPGSVIEPPAGKRVPGTAFKIAHASMKLDLNAQFMRAAGDFYHFIELDNADTCSLGRVQEAITQAHAYGLGVVAKNPTALVSPLPILAHANTVGVIIERGAGGPTTLDALRRQVRKDGLLPIWFVFEGPEGAQDCATVIRHGGYRGMGVSYSRTSLYKDSIQVLTPIA